MPHRFSDSERLLVLKALNHLKAADPLLSKKISKIATKIIDFSEHPDITVGVHGGQVQWILGNPFPVRICDYDGDPEDLSDVDERGQQCRMWLEPTDNAVVQSRRVSR